MEYSWGRYPLVEGELWTEKEYQKISSKLSTHKSVITRGLGRSYGDSSLHQLMLSSLKLNRFLEFDEKTGLLKCQSGLSLSEIIEVFLPRGWFIPVSPGTKFITVGGAVASDIHGKNHHSEGSFGKHLHSFLLMVSDGTIINCSPTENQDLFNASLGGMGLTGIILEVSFYLKRVKTAFINQRNRKAKNLAEIFELFEDSMDDTYSVSWIDCMQGGKSLGRSILMTGEHAEEKDLENPQDPFPPIKEGKLKIPFYFPSGTLNSLTIKAFNFLYYRKELKQDRSFLGGLDPFFYPLDSIHNWNKIYGKKGFLQYQFVIPKSQGFEGMTAILKKIKASGQGSFLAVLKYFGPGRNMLSFPMEGYTLALDFPVSRKLFKLLDELDSMVIDYGGRIYLTKDARMSPETFRSGYPDLDKFLAIKNKVDPGNLFRSHQSDRLKITT